MHKTMAFLVLLISSSCQKVSPLLPRHAAVSTRRLNTGRRITRMTQHLASFDFQNGFCRISNHRRRRNPKHHHAPNTYPSIARLSLYEFIRTSSALSASSDASLSGRPNSSNSSSIIDQYTSLSCTFSTISDNKNEAVVSAIQRSFQEHILPHFHDDKAEDEATKIVPNLQSPLVVVISVSGGCDSMALLHGMVQFCRHHHVPPVKLTVAHFNHKQRGIESDLDCELVVKTCEHYGLTCHVYSWEDHIQQQEEHASTATERSDSNGSTTKFSQDIARRWRRKTLSNLVQMECVKINGSHGNDEHDQKVAQQQQRRRPRGIILTAHHKDDSYESLLLKALRGAHITNLHEGIAPCSTVEEGSDRDSIQLLRPFLSLSKQDLISYLQNNKDEFAIEMPDSSSSGATSKTLWREDESNSSPKYLRNRVRNELIPLLVDILSKSNPDDDEDDDDTQSHRKSNHGRQLLERRLDNFMQQSNEIADDLQSRVDLCLQHSLVDNGKYFQVRMAPSSSSSLNDDGKALGLLSTTPLVRSHALYQWISSIVGENSVSYEQLRRIIQQLDDYASNRQWKLEIGSHWNIVRIGDVLSVISNHGVGDDEDSHTALDCGNLPLSYRILSDHHQDEESNTSLTIAIPQSMMNNDGNTLTVMASTVGSWSSASDHTTSLTFVPKWRKGRTPIKLKQFLRGQNVPLHERDTIPIILLQRDKKLQGEDGVTESNVVVVVVAVYVDNKWLIHADYDSSTSAIEGENNPNDTTTHHQKEDDMAYLVQVDIPETISN